MRRGTEPEQKPGTINIIQQKTIIQKVKRKLTEDRGIDVTFWKLILQTELGKLMEVYLRAVLMRSTACSSESDGGGQSVIEL